MEKYKKIFLLITKIESQIELLNQEISMFKKLAESFKKNNQNSEIVNLNNIQSSMTVSDFGHLISTRLYRILKLNYENFTLQELSIYQDGELLRKSGLGIKTLKELRYLILISESNKD